MKSSQMGSDPGKIILANGPLNNIQFSDIFNIEDIQLIQNLFADANGIFSVITQVDGTPITHPSNFSRICADMIGKT